MTKKIEIIPAYQKEILILDKQHQVNLTKLFTPEGMDFMIAEIEKEVKTFTADVTTKKGQADIKSMAYKVSLSKGVLEKLAKELKEEHQEIIKNINSEVNKAKDRLDALRDEIRKPVDEIEVKEEARIKERQTRISEIDRLSTTRAFNNITELKKIITDLETLKNFDWQEFDFKAKTSYETAKLYLETELEKGLKYEADQARLAQLEREAIGRAKKDHEEKIVKEAAEKAKREAEEATSKAIKDAEEAKKNAELRIKEAERLFKEQVEQAAKRERDKIEAEQIAYEEAAKKRQANELHRNKIIENILEDMREISSLPSNASWKEKMLELILAISTNKIRHLSIKY